MTPETEIVDTPDTAEAQPPVTNGPLPDVTIPEKDFALMVELRLRVTVALARYNTANEEAKSKRKAFEAARETFEEQFDRLIAKTKGEDLPLFNQTDANEKAIQDSNARLLEKRLREVANIEITAIHIAGWSAEQIIETEHWLDQVQSTDPGEEWPTAPAWVLDAGEIRATLDQETAKKIREMSDGSDKGAEA